MFMKKVKVRKQKLREFHIFYNRTASRLGFPWIIQANKQKWGASHIVFSGTGIRTFEGGCIWNASDERIGSLDSVHFPSIVNELKVRI
jgi:hypothetical protein